MQDHAAYLDAILNRLHRNPVLTAMMVTSLIIGVTASIAGVASWRANSACIAERSSPPALQADLVLGVGQTTSADPAPSRKVSLSQCPCAAPSRWHWQRI
jgi:hypothetical protein